MSEDKRLCLLYRVEPGCLGPTGIDYVEGFCEFASQKIKAPAYAHFSFVPRYDKSLSEREYIFAGRTLTANQVCTFLDKFDKDKNDFEEQIDELLSHAIDAYLNRA